MSDESPSIGESESRVHEDAHVSRLELLADVVIFQIKLVADGIRDIFLSPLSIIAAAVGLMVGGDRPERYFRKVIRFGRRTEVWIDLFDEHKGRRTAEEFVSPVRSRVIHEAQVNPWLSKVGTRLNRHLDEVNSALTTNGHPQTSGDSQPPLNSGSQVVENAAQGDEPRPLR
jgi:hypothetical protein